MEAWQRQLLRAASPADAVHGFKDLDAESGSREHERGGQAVRARAHDHHVARTLTQRSSTIDSAASSTEASGPKRPAMASN